MEGAAGPVTFSRRELWVNVGLISVAWCFAVSALFIQVSVTTAASQDLASEALSTIPLGLFTLTAAFAVIPTLYLMHPDRLGRRRTFLLTITLAAVGSVVNMVGILTGQVSLLMVGAIPQGASWATSLNYRYLATAFIPLTRSSPNDAQALLPKVLAVAVLGGAAAAAVGPETTRHARTVFEQYDYLGSYVVLLVIHILHGLVLLLIRLDSLQQYDSDTLRLQTAIAHSELAADHSDRDHDDHDECEEDNHKQQSGHSKLVTVEEEESGSLQKQPALTNAGVFKLIKSNISLQNGMLGTALGYSIMVDLMNGTPLAARDAGYSFDFTTILVQVHLLGMFLPSLVSGNIAQKIGKQLTVVVGFGVMLVASAIYYIGGGYEKPALIIGVILVGIGWNLTFVGGSSLIAASSDQPAERAKIQGVSDTLLTSLTAVAILLTGFLFDRMGWIGFNALQTGLTAAAFVASTIFYIVHYRQSRSTTSG